MPMVLGHLACQNRRDAGRAITEHCLQWCFCGEYIIKKVMMLQNLPPERIDEGKDIQSLHGFPLSRFNTEFLNFERREPLHLLSYRCRKFDAFAQVQIACAPALTSSTISSHRPGRSTISKMIRSLLTRNYRQNSNALNQIPRVCALR